MLKVRNGTTRGYIEVQEGGGNERGYPNSNTRRGRVIDEGNTTPTIDTTNNAGAVEFNGKQVRIRKLTPRECFRAQGFPDEYFERAAEVNSNSQLYKQAGNSVTVNVIYEIARRLS